jgi:hypothetical protein
VVSQPLIPGQNPQETPLVNMFTSRSGADTSGENLSGPTPGDGRRLYALVQDILNQEFQMNRAEFAAALEDLGFNPEDEMRNLGGLISMYIVESEDPNFVNKADLFIRVRAKIRGVLTQMSAIRRQVAALIAARETGSDSTESQEPSPLESAESAPDRLTINNYMKTIRSHVFDGPLSQGKLAMDQVMLAAGILRKTA